MQHKVLLADDSLTIQKVIKITLANEPYQIIECNNEADLNSRLTSENPRLVFLDFTLSEDKSGYEICKHIIAKSPDTKILIMYGTFDTIDEAQFLASGASDKIVKPFDSSKFINICRNLINESSIAKVKSRPIAEAMPDIIEEPSAAAEFHKELNSFDEVDEWTVDGPVNEIDSIEEASGDFSIDESAENFSQPENKLTQEISDWGIEVPSVIGGSEFQEDILPPVIEDANTTEPQISAQDLTDLNENNIKFDSIDEFQTPDSDDLEYPDLNSLNDTNLEDIYSAQKSEFEEVDSIKQIEDQISDETDDLWSADENLESTMPTINKIENIALPDDIPDDDIPAPVEEDADEEIIFETKEFKFEEVDEPAESPKPISAEVDIDKITNLVIASLNDRIEDLVNKKIELLLNKKFSESTEKIAWEIIPELAENLIRDEIKKISTQVLNE